VSIMLNLLLTIATFCRDFHNTTELNIDASLKLLQAEERL